MIGGGIGECQPRPRVLHVEMNDDGESLTTIAGTTTTPATTASTTPISTLPTTTTTSGNGSGGTSTSTMVVAPTNEEEEEEEEDTSTLGESADMELANGSNPWLPAYGFQLQHHSHFQPTHEDLRANDTVLVQQVDFLETILEETSDDLQSDSDRSGTTYWLGSDSETESVIHIRAKQRSADERHDGSGSECNSVVPKKRRRRNHGGSSDGRDHQVPGFEDFPLSPRSSRSSGSSRSSSLLQFESLERTCATLSPSSYSYDSLEYSNRSNASHPETTSPDSLEQEDYDRVLSNGFPGPGAGTDQFSRIRPYRSFESLDACQKEDDLSRVGLSNGFAPLYLKSGGASDLSRTRRNEQCPRDFWHEDEEYEEDEEDDEDLDLDDRRYTGDNHTISGFEDRLLVFGDSTCNYATTLDYRNTIDLREIGVETKRDTFLDLKSGQAAVSTSLRLLQARLNISGGMAHGRGNMVGDRHHHHRHHHHRQQNQQQQQHHHQPHQQHHHHHQLHYDEHEQQRQQCQQYQQNYHHQRQGWSEEECFNFRFTDKSQSAPSLPSSAEECGHDPRTSLARTSSRTTSFVSTSSIFENYTRVASVPVDLNLCGVSCADDDTVYRVNSDTSLNDHEMADGTVSDAVSEAVCSVEPSSDSQGCPSTYEVTEATRSDELSSGYHGSQNAYDDSTSTATNTTEEEDTIVSPMSSVRTQAAQGASLGHDGQVHNDTSSRNESCVGGDHCEEQPRQKKQQVTSTVKTQDRGNAVLGMANDIDAVVDEAIRQFKREVEEATVAGGTHAALLALENAQRSASVGKQRPRRVKNNASYELAQQFEVDERNFSRNRMPACKEATAEDERSSGGSPRSAGRKRVVNNASYELALQCDYIKALQSARGAFQRMNACDELEEGFGRSSRLKVTDMVQQMSSGSASNLSSSYAREPVESRVYSRSTENISTSFYATGNTHANHAPSAGGKKDPEESLLAQIKKNSDPFSLYGEGANAHALLDDEVDFPCLETKPIGAISTERVVLWEEEEEEDDGVRQRTYHYQNISPGKERIIFEERPESIGTMSSELISILNENFSRSVGSFANDSEHGNKSFIGELYPDRNAPVQRDERRNRWITDDEDYDVEEERGEDSEEESPRSPSSACSTSAGERLWRVVVEKQTGEKEASVEKVTKEEKEEEAVVAAEDEMVGRVEKGEEKRRKETAEEVVEATAAPAPAPPAAPRGHSVHSVRSSPPCGAGGRLEPSERSGNPAVAVAVDTYHRGDQDKRHEEKAAAVTTAAVVRSDHENAVVTTMSTASTTFTTQTTTKRPFAASNAKKDSTRLPRNAFNDSMNQTTVTVNNATTTVAPTNKSEERKKGGLGGFLQRFSRLRFSGRSKVPRSEVQKKSGEAPGQVNRAVRPHEDHLQQQQHQKKKEPDYIIIPLHPPEDDKQRGKDEVVTLEARPDGPRRNNNVDVQRSASSVSSNGRAPVSSKPPLPPQPPRVGALGSRTAAAAGGGGGGGASASASSRRRAATDLGNPAAIEMAKARTMQAAQERPVGLLETDLDEAVPSTTSTTATGTAGKKTRSLLNLNHTSAAAPRQRPENALHVPQSPVGSSSHRSQRDDGTAVSSINQRPHKSMEFLLDKENLHFVKPPENELQKVGERVPSEHELRVQRSLQRLNVPDWYKNSPAARDGFRLKRHSDASQHGGWRALGSKTTSLSSLSSSSNRQPTTGALLSPSPTPPVFSRWSTSLLNSAGSSPASSARSSFNHRQPYLGWRSQERLTNPRTPAERLAQGILSQLQTANKNQQQQQQQQQQTTNQQLEVRNSIKEVTSAIVHYVQSGQEVGGGGRLSPRPRPEDWDDRGGARSTSPRGSVKLCWMESSFVGTRPVDSPETPMSLATETDCCAGCNATGTESCSCVDSATSGLYLDLTPTRDDVQLLQQQHQQQQQALGGGGGSGSLCPSPSSSSNYHHHRHHHRQLHHQQQQQQQQQQRHHRGELLLA